MKHLNINNLNSGLMLISLATAWVFPFELFLFAYAVLGPLHYLTEIHWLHKKNYFATEKYEPHALMLASLFLFLLLFVSGAALATKILIGAFCAAAVMAVDMNIHVKYSLYAIIVVVLIFLPAIPILFLLFAVLLPTLIHVYVFTGAFMLYGTMKDRSLSGFISLFLFLAAPVVLFFLTTVDATALPSAYAQGAYALFAPLNQTLLSLMGTTVNDAIVAVYLSATGVAIMKCIAFAYTYHYLNWFSKTTVIRWNVMTKKARNAIVLVWLISVILYAVDYRLGLFALYFLSMLHVLLEFPLDHKTFMAIGSELRKKLMPQLTRG